MASSMDLMTSQNQYLTNLTNYYQSIFDLQSQNQNSKNCLTLIRKLKISRNTSADFIKEIINYKISIQ